MAILPQPEPELPPTEVAYEPQRVEAPLPLDEPSNYRLFVYHGHPVPYIGLIVHMLGNDGQYHEIYNEVLRSDGEVVASGRPYWARFEPPFPVDLDYFVDMVLSNYGFSPKRVKEVQTDISTAAMAAGFIWGVDP